MRVAAEPFIDAIRSVVGDASIVPLSEPAFEGREWEYCRQCLDEGWVSSVGAFVDRFEVDLSQRTGARFVVATSSGTSALHLALVTLGIGPGDEVLVPALTFVATANAVRHAGGMPHFVDVDPVDLGLSPRAVAERLRQVGERREGRVVNRETGARIAAVMPMHCFGFPADVDGLLSVCREWGLPLIEDAAESLGSTRGGRHTGTSGMAGALSFNGNKIITTGGGGAVMTDDADFADLARHLGTTGRVPDPVRFSHDRVAWNFRMPNINAALGCAQLEQLDERLERRRRLHQAYAEALTDIPGVTLLGEPAGTKSNHWLQVVEVDAEDRVQRDDLIRSCHSAGIQARPVWEPMHELPMYRDAPRGPLDTTDRLADRLVNLPSSVRV